MTWGSCPKAIDNSQVVREVDPRSSRELWLLVGLVAALAGSLGLYAWPTLHDAPDGHRGRAALPRA